MHRYIDALTDLLFVPKCAGCGQRMDSRGNTLCGACKERYLAAREEYCDFCGMEAALCSCVPQKLLMQGCSDYRKLAFYKPGGEVNAFRNMIFSVKKRYNLRLMRFFMQELADLGTEGLTDPLVTYIPRSRKAKREFGYDQGKLLSGFYAEITASEYRSLFRHKPFRRQKEQKLLNYAQRAANIRGAYVLRCADLVSDRDVILVDDVVTSGATVSECTSMLYAAGAKTVAVRSIAYTYRKNKKKKD